MITVWRVTNCDTDNAKLKFLFEHQELSAILHPCIADNDIPMLLTYDYTSFYATTNLSIYF